LSQVNLENKELTNERLEIGAGVVYFLGPNLTLRHCELVLKIAARNLIIPQARFMGCTFQFKRALKNFRWNHAHLKGCRFTGRLTGNDFGNWPDDPGEGSIEDCDFSGAHVDESRFLECDVRTIRFPPWPYFTLLDTARRWRELEALPWPGSIGQIEAKGFAKDPPTTVAVTFSAPELAKRSGTTSEAIKAVLTKLDGVVY
jgi:hypothetical protein